MTRLSVRLVRQARIDEVDEVPPGACSAFGVIRLGVVHMPSVVAIAGRPGYRMVDNCGPLSRGVPAPASARDAPEALDDRTCHLSQPFPRNLSHIADRFRHAAKVDVRSDSEPGARRVAREIACSPDNLSGATRRQAHAGFERLPGRVQAAARSPDGALRDLQGQRVKRVLQRVRTVSLSLI
jgi:hypothetical protein